LPLDQAEPTLKALEGVLEELLALEEGYAAAARPESSSRYLATALDRVMERIEGSAATGPVRKHGQSLYEDVLTVASNGSWTVAEAPRLSALTAQEILTYAELISRFACLFNHRHDVLHTLASVWAERWPSRQKMGFLELFQEFQGMWNRYLRFDRTERYDNFSSFDPLELPAMAELKQIRRIIREVTVALLEDRSEGA